MSTRYVPANGMSTWPEPDPAAAQGPELAGGLDVELVTERDDGWAQIRCSNGWEAWVDGRLLLAAPPAAAKPFGGIPPKYLAGAAVAAVVVFLFATSGDDKPGGGPGPGNISASPAAANDFRDEDVRKAIADAEAAPAAAPAGEDEDAAKQLRDELRAAGYDVGTDIAVVPFFQTETMVHLTIASDSPLNALGSDQGGGFLAAIAKAPATAEYNITRVYLEFSGTDTQGPFNAELTVAVADLLEQAANGTDITSRMAIQVTRP